jgi:hypothetical protein
MNRSLSIALTVAAYAVTVAASTFAIYVAQGVMLGLSL